MTLGMTTATFTLVHVVLSLVSIFSGFVVMFGLLIRKRLDAWTGLFLATTVATCVTGFGFPFDLLLSSHRVGMISLSVVTVAILARYALYLAGAWRRIYVVGVVVALYLNVFLAIAQLFPKVPELKAMAPTQTELPFVLAQLLVVALFVMIGIFAWIGFNGARPAKHEVLPFPVRRR
jgi:hypothetical protein